MLFRFFTRAKTFTVRGLHTDGIVNTVPMYPFQCVLVVIFIFSSPWEYFGVSGAIGSRLVCEPRVAKPIVFAVISLCGVVARIMGLR
jgi:hypothetical protein